MIKYLKNEVDNNMIEFKDKYNLTIEQNIFLTKKYLQL